MKLRFKHQKFQAYAAKAVCDILARQQYITPSHMIDSIDGNMTETLSNADDWGFTGFGSARITLELSDGLIIEHIQRIQRSLPR